MRLIACRSILLDSCFMIQCIRTLGRIEQALSGNLVQNNSTPMITRTILSEIYRLSSMLGLGEEKLETYYLLLELLFFLDDRIRKIILEAQYIKIHPPDNLHIASAKSSGSALISYNRLLVQNARNEGVEAYFPEEMLERIGAS